MTHEVRVLCNCDEDPCRMEVYVSDVRIAVAELDELRRLRAAVEQVWATNMDVLRKTALDERIPDASTLSDHGLWDSQRRCHAFAGRAFHYCEHAGVRMFFLDPLLEPTLPKPSVGIRSGKP